MNEKTFFFYDLETSGATPAVDRIMQFAGQRTNLDLEPIGDPINVLVRLSDDILPKPIAIKITGITPQQTLRDGLSEPDFLRLLEEKVFIPGTILTGYNSVRFDNLFLRFTRYRNFYNAYDWSYKNDRSYWDLLDVTRLIRALRPEGVNWPVKVDGGAKNTLELLAQANGLLQPKAHDALSDVSALIDLAKLLKSKQPRTFAYLLEMRTKASVVKFLESTGQAPFVYTSGNYPINELHTTAVTVIGQKARRDNYFVYDLKRDPDDYAEIDDGALADSRFATREMRAAPGYIPFPAKELTPNKCPAIAPLSVLLPDTEACARINITREQIETNLAKLRNSNLPLRLAKILDREHEFPPADAEIDLYSGFISDSDEIEMRRIRQCKPADFLGLKANFKDARLNELFLRYKARNYPETLSDDEVRAWEEYRADRLNADMLEFAAELEKLAAEATPEELSLFTDLRLWAETIMPL